MKFIVPGYLFLCVFNGISGKERRAESIWIWSAIISFLTLSIVETIATHLTCDLSVWESSVLCISTDIVLGIILALFCKLDYVKRFMIAAFGTTLEDGTISNVIDWKNGSNVAVYLKNEPIFFVGHVITVGDNKGDGWICISSPIKCLLGGVIQYSHETESETYLTIPLENVSYIKVDNNKD